MTSDEGSAPIWQLTDAQFDEIIRRAHALGRQEGLELGRRQGRRKARGLPEEAGRCGHPFTNPNSARFKAYAQSLLDRLEPTERAKIK